MFFSRNNRKIKNIMAITKHYSPKNFIENKLNSARSKIIKKNTMKRNFNLTPINFHTKYYIDITNKNELQRVTEANIKKKSFGNIQKFSKRLFLKKEITKYNTTERKDSPRFAININKNINNINNINTYNFERSNITNKINNIIRELNNLNEMISEDNDSYRNSVFYTNI